MSTSIVPLQAGRHRFFGNALHRTGAEGYEKETSWALEHYFNTVARYVAMEKFKPEAVSMYNRWFGDFTAEPKTNEAELIRDYINDVNGNPRKIEIWLNELIELTPIGKWVSDAFDGRPALMLSSNLSWFNAVTKLGLGNVASALINFSQFINVGTALNDYGQAMDGLKRALNPSAQDKKIIEESGVMDEINMSADAGGYTQRRYAGKFKNTWGRIKYLGDYFMLPFTYADTLMRKAAILGRYYQATKNEGLSHKAALESARTLNWDANGDYSSANTPDIFRAGSVVTQQMFQFQKYPIFQMEFIWNYVVKAKSNKQRARFIAPYLLMSGLTGALPFGALLNNLFSFIVGMLTGDDEDIGLEIQNALWEWADDDEDKKKFVGMLLHGILAGADIDVSKRVGLVNTFGGEFYGYKPETSWGTAGAVLGGPFVSTVLGATSQMHEGNPVETIKAISPSIGNGLQAYFGETHGKHHRIQTRYESMYYRMIHALGFRNMEETQRGTKVSYSIYNSQKEAELKKDAIDYYLDHPNDPTARQEIIDWGITDKQIQKYKKQREMSAKERDEAKNKKAK